MKILNEKLQQLKKKISEGDTLTVMIIGLGSVGTFLLDYLVSRSDPKLRIIVVGRSYDKMEKDVNIVRTAAAIRGQLRSEIIIADGCDLNDPESISGLLKKHSPDFIVNSSRVYPGLKYGSISWSNLRAYGIWTPLSIRFARNIMEAYASTGCHAITINTSYSDAVIPWLKSAGRCYFDFGSGNLNHLIPRIKFAVAEEFGVDNLNEIDVTLVTSHFHDVVISKEGHAEGQHLLLDINYNGSHLDVDQEKLFRACSIPMPIDQKRNMMNASSNYNIISSLIKAIKYNTKVKVHSPGVNGEIGGYPVIIDGSTVVPTAYYDTTFSIDEMRNTNRKSIYCDGIENIENGCLIYTDELVDKVKSVFHCNLPKKVCFDEIDTVAEFLIKNIIEKRLNS